jgi:hypothetical protein
MGERRRFAAFSARRATQSPTAAENGDASVLSAVIVEAGEAYQGRIGLLAYA